MHPSKTDDKSENIMIFFLQRNMFLPISSSLFDIAMFDATDEELVFSDIIGLDVDLLVVVEVLSDDIEGVGCTVDEVVEDIDDDGDVCIDDDNNGDNDVIIDGCVANVVSVDDFDEVVDIDASVGISVIAIFSPLSSTIVVIFKSKQSVKSSSLAPSSFSPLYEL